MEHDKFLRDILANGIQQPSSNFTAKVMKQLQREVVLRDEKVEMPILLIVLSVVFPIVALVVSLKPVYSRIDVFTKSMDIDGIISPQALIVLSLGIFLFCIFDLYLKKRFVKRPSLSQGAA